MTVLALTATILVSLAKAAPAVREQDSQGLTETEKLTVELVNARTWGAKGWKRFRAEKLERIHLAARVRVLQRRLLKLRGRRGVSAPSASVPAWFVSSALCVHRGEGAWSANTGNGFYGGMQFMLSTWQSVGGRGLPSNASPAEQIYRAYLLWKRSGWGPWPNTARACGLL